MNLVVNAYAYVTISEPDEKPNREKAWTTFRKNGQPMTSNVKVQTQK